MTTVVIGERPHAVTTARDGTGFLWDLATGERVGGPLFTRSEPVEDVTTVEIGGRAGAVVVDRDGTLAVVDLGTRREVIERLSIGHTKCVTSAVIDSRPYAITGHPDGTVRTWELSPLPQGGRPVPGQRQYVSAVVMAELDRRPHVVSGAFGGSVRTWDLATGAPGTALETGADNADIAHATIRINGREHVVTTSDHGASAKVWAGRSANRSPTPASVRTPGSA